MKYIQLKDNPSMRRFLLFLSVLLLVLIIAIVLMYQLFFRALNEELMTMNRNTAQELASRMEEALDQANRLGAEIISDNENQLFFTYSNPDHLVKNYMEELGSRLHVTGIPYIDSVVLYAPQNGNVVFSNDPNKTYTLDVLLEEPRLYDTGWLEEIPNSSRTATNYCVRAKCDRWPYYYSVVKRYRSGKIDGVVVVNIDLQKLYTHLINKNQETTQLFVVDASSRVVLRKDKQELYLPVSDINELSDFQSGHTEEYMMVSGENGYSYEQIPLESYDLTCVTITEVGEHVLSLSRIRRQYLIIAVVAVFLLLSMVVFQGVRQNRSLRDIRQLLENVDLHEADISYQEEIRDIAAKIIHHMQTNSKLQAELDTRLHLLKDSQMLALQAQINPHFVFNTLNVISLMTESSCGDGHPAVEMIGELSEILRYSLSENEFVRIEEEVAYVKRYLSIMKYRYENFTTAIHVDPAISDCRIPKLVLQPLIENALHHGLASCLEQHEGILALSIQQIMHTYEGGVIKQSVSICVSDNGIGMTADQLSAQRQNISSPKDIAKDHIGLSNVAHRFYLLFNHEQEISIESAPGEGTCVQIIFPLV